MRKTAASLFLCAVMVSGCQVPALDNIEETTVPIPMTTEQETEEPVCHACIL